MAEQWGGPRRKVCGGLPALSLTAALLALTGCGDGGQESGKAADDTATTASAQTTEGEAASSTEAPEKYIWDLSDLYPNPAAWAQARQNVLNALPQIEAFKGKLGQSANTLLAALELISKTYKEATRVSVYANLIADANLRDGKAQERRQLAQQMQARLGEAVSFLPAEIIEAGAVRIRAFLAERPEAFARFRFGLEDTLRQAPHTLGKEAAAVLAASELLTGAPNNIYSVLAESDIPWSAITLPDGTEAKINPVGYAKYSRHRTREVRKQVFDAFWTKFSEYENTFGALLMAEVQSNLYQAKARRYASVLDWALADDNLPPAVYRTLVAEVNRGLPTLHRYFKLRARMLGVTHMAYYDIYPPLAEYDRKYDIEESRQLTIAATSPLGPDFVNTLSEATSKRWVHAYPREGKQSGAYMSGGAYDVHPYVFLNHNGSFDSLSTYAHEWGHAMHSILTNANQPWELADYSTFIGEVASIGQELLLFQYMMDRAKSDDEKLFYLGQALERFRSTFFRQTMFAEFELAIHEQVEEGRALSGDRLTEIYGELLKRYHGHDKGVVNIDDKVMHEWAYIPHFYYDFYVFQYSTAIAAASYLAQRVGTGEEGAAANFLTMLKAGGSKYPYDILRDAGLDMASPAPYRALIARMDSIMDRIEEILDRRKGKGRK